MSLWPRIVSVIRMGADMIDCVHHIAGRLRIKQPALKKNPPAASALQDAIARCHGVRRVEVNIVTGSVVVHYDPQVTEFDALLALLRIHPPCTSALPFAGALPSASNQQKFADKLVTGALEKLIERSLFALAATLL